MSSKGKKKNEEIKEEEILKQDTEQQEETKVEEKEETKVDETTEKDPLETANETIAHLNDKHLRLSAEFDNYRKRTMKEKSELIRNGGERVITSLLPILDDMERALENIEKTEDLNSIREGIELIYNKYLKVLGENGVEKIETEEKAFDTDYHEAIAMVPSPEEDKKGKILDCVQNGYILNEKVIRHAKVVVAQ